jgi:DUF971 family protein
MTAMDATTPRVITRSDPGQLRIEWADGAETVYSSAELRRLCPCAHCVNEVTGERMLDPTSIPDFLTHLDVRLVGNYALAIRFSDQHDTGIFPFTFLRENDPAG